MQDKNFENQVKELLYNHSETAPNVMGKVFEKRTPLYVFKNRLILHKYKLMAAAVLIGLIAFLFNTPIDKSQTNTPVAEQTTAPSENLPNNNNDQTSDPAIAQNDTESNMVEDNPYKEESTNQVAQDVSDQSHTTVETNTHTNTPSTSENNRRSEITGNRANQSIISQNDVPTITPDNDNAIAEGSAFENNVDKTSEKPIPSEQPEVKEKQIVDNVEKVDNEPKVNSAESIVETTTSDDNGVGDDDFDVPTTKPSKFSLSFGTIVGVGGRSLDQSGDNATIDMRNSSESQKLSYGAEILLNYRLSNNLDIYSGLSFYDRREGMRYDYTTQVTDMQVQSKKVIEHHPVFGTREITVYDTSYSTRNVQANGDYNNSYKHVFIPVGLRYTLYYSDRWGVHMSFNGGLEVVTQTTGTILTDQYQELSLDKGFARTSAGGMVGLGIGGSYLLNDRLSLLGEFKGNIFLDPTNGPAYPINQTDRGYGLMLGLKYDL